MAAEAADGTAPREVSELKIISLLENTTQRDDMKIEHGLSLYIETESRKILFDMGQSDIFSDNAKTLGADLSAVDLAVLSHGHYDHSGGLKKFLEINKNAPVYIHRDAFLPHCNGTEKYIGVDTSLKDHPQIVFTDEYYKIGEGLELFSCNDRKRKYPLLPSGLTEKTEDGFIPDDFRHEQYLLIEEKGKRVLISGCSHKGILDIASYFSPDYLIGGFHYSKLPCDSFLENAARELSSYPTQFFTCHCTGYEQYEFMKQFMPQLQYLSCGKEITI